MWDWISSGPASLFAGAILGVFLGAIFDDTLKRQFSSTRRLIRRWTKGKRELPNLAREFQLGPLHVPCMIIEGYGEKEIEEQNVRILVNPAEVQLPPALASRRAEIRTEHRKKQENGERHAWNGPRYAVEDLIVSRTRDSENSKVTLILKYSDYFTFLATQQLDRRLPGGATPRTLYLENRPPQDAPDFMKSCFGINVAVVTEDGWLIVSRRGNAVEVGKDLWNSTVNEGLSREKDSSNGDPPNIFKAARRGIKEELQLPPAAYSLHLLAFHVVTTFSQWGTLFVAHLNRMSKDDFASHASRGIEDGWEHPEFDYIQFKPASVLRYLIRSDRISSWAPAAPVLYYLSLVHSFGRQRVDTIADRILRELPREGSTNT